MKKKHSVIKRIIATIFSLLLAAGITAAVFLIYKGYFKKPCLNLNDYVKIKYSGLNSVASATVSYDLEKFDKDYKNQKKNYYLHNKSKISSEVLKLDEVNGTLDYDSDLSNGDVITYHWEVEPSFLEEAYGYDVKYSDMTFTVSGLEELKTFDPFEGIEHIKALGISSVGRAVAPVRPDDEMYSKLAYRFDKEDHLSNGDQVTLKLTDKNGNDPTKYCIDNYGVKPATLEKTFTVDTLGTPVQSIDQISDDAIKQMKEASENNFETVYSYSQGSAVRFDKLKFIGTYVLSAKSLSDDTMESKDKDIVYMIYKEILRDRYSNSKLSFYWYCAFRDVYLDPSGEVEVYLTVNHTDFPEYFNKYVTLKDMEKDVIKPNKKLYNIEKRISE